MALIDVVSAVRRFSAKPFACAAGVFASALCVHGAGVEKDWVRSSDLRTGDIQQSSASDWYALTPNTRLRVQFRPGDPYFLTASTTNFPGMLWFYLLGAESPAPMTGGFDATVDFTGADFRHAPVAGEVINDTGGDAFSIYGWNYKQLATLAGIGGSQSSVDTYRFAGTKMKFRAYPGYDWDWIFEGGTVSFAGVAGTRTSGTLQLPVLTRDGRVRNIYDNAATYLPALQLTANHRDCLFRANGGTFVNNGTLKSNVDSAAAPYAGSNVVEAVGGVRFTQKGAVLIGGAGNRDVRTDVFSVRDAGTVFEFGGGAFTAVGRTLFDVSGGASFVATSEGKQDFSFGGAGTVDRRAVLNVTGEGSLFDFSNQDGSLKLSGAGTEMTVADGAELRLPYVGYLGISSSDDVRVTLSGDGSKIVAGGKTGSILYLPYAGTGTYAMSGGYLGRADGNGLALRLGYSDGSVGTFGMSGGRIELPGSGTSGILSVGGYGSATFTLSGGEIVVSNSISLASYSDATYTRRRRSLFHQTGGRIYCFYGVTVCGGDSALIEAELRLDGGELICDQITGSGTRAAGKSATGILSADGGTVKARQTRQYADWPWMRGLDAVVAGPKGLTVDTDGFAIRFCQKVYTNKTGTAGTFVKTGLGTLKMQSIETYAISNTVVRAGTLLFDTDESVTLDSAVTLEGGVLSIAGEGSVGNLVVRSIVAGAGELLVDPTDVITVTGTGSDFSGLNLRFSSAPAAGASYPLFRFEHPLTEAQRDGLRNVYCRNVLGDGYHGRLAYDEETGRVSFAVVPDAASLGPAAETVWTGAAGGTWSAAENWSAGVPAGTNRAVFGAGAAVRAVDTGDADVGALRFDGTGYRLSGGTIDFRTETGAAEIAAETGTVTEISSAVSFHGTALAVDVGAGASLAVPGTMTGSGVTKRGKGLLSLAGENAFFGDLTAAGGTLALAGAGCADGETGILADADTVRFDVEGLKLGRLWIGGETGGSPVVLDARKDVSVSGIDVSGDGCGGYIKRGEGVFTLDATGETAGMTIVGRKGSGSNGRPGTAAATFFPGDGSAPAADAFGGLNVAEGEFVIKGRNRKPQIKIPGAIVIGVNVTNVNASARPTLTFEDVYIDNWNGVPGHLQIGYGAGVNGAVQSAPCLNVRNSFFMLDTLRMGLDGGTGGAVCTPTFICTNSTVSFIWQFYLSDCVGNAMSVIRFTDSTVWSSSSDFPVNGAVDAVFDNCRVGKGLGVAAFDEDGYVNIPVWRAVDRGRILFTGGTRAHVRFSGLNRLAEPFALEWNDAEWNYGWTADYTNSLGAAGQTFGFTLSGGGIILRPAAGTTFTTDVAFRGAGGLRHLGGGTVRFGAGAYGFTGVCYAQEGAVVDLSDAGPVAGASFAGAGTVKGGSLSAARIVLGTDDAAAAEVPTFDGCSFTGSVALDFGRTAENPLPCEPTEGIVVAKVAGGTARPPFKLVNTGLEGKRGEYTVTAAGEVVMTLVDSGGLTLIVR